MQAAEKNLNAVAFLGSDRTGRISPIWPLRCVHLRLLDFAHPVRRRADGLPGPGNAHSDQPRQCQHHRRKLDDTCFGYDLVVAQFLQEVAANSVSEQR